MNYNNKPEIINKIIKNDWLNVFLVASPILAIVAKMFIEHYNLQNKNILIVSLRNTSLEILDYNFLKITPKKKDRYLERIFFDSPSGRKILNKINDSNRDFIVYSGWAYREVNWLLNSRRCKGHIYIEEGSGSYLSYRPYSRKHMTLIDFLNFNWRNKVNPIEGKGFFFRDDAHLFVGINEKSYPEINREKKIILTNIDKVQKYYNPKLVGIKIIGITCSASRLKSKQNWKEMLVKLISFLPDNSVIKPHPSFTSSKKLTNIFYKIFQSVNSKKISLCSSDVILELEMLKDKKKIIGPKSSMERYTKLFGSEYEKVKLY